MQLKYEKNLRNCGAARSGSPAKGHILPMQPKISSFFNRCSSSTMKSVSSDPPPISADGDDDLALCEGTHKRPLNASGLKSPNSHDRDSGNEAIKEPSSESPTKPMSENNGCWKPEARSCYSGKVLNRKRSYVQFHLNLGQSDFTLRRCSTCGFNYAPGDETDEKEHRTIHRNYTHGIPFKAWRHERVVHIPCSKGGHVIVVSDSDPAAQRKKVQEVIKMMEIDLGGGWIFHKLCKVYLLISSQRVAGCVVVEPIKEAFRLILRSWEETSNRADQKNSRANSTTLQFGKFIFHRETTKKVHSVNSPEGLNEGNNGAIICEEEGIPAVCGIRAIWVAPANRRRQIASQLLDAVRKSFCTDFTLDQSQLAFSPPTSAGKALASSYTNTKSFLVYKPDAAYN